MIAWIVETMIATTLLMLLVLVLRKPVARQFGPGIAYALWLLPVLRLFVPPLPGAWQPSALLAPLTRASDPAPAMFAARSDLAAQPAAAFDPAVLRASLDPMPAPAGFDVLAAAWLPDAATLLAWLIGLWVAGALAFLGFHLIAHQRFCSRLLRGAQVRRTVADGRVHILETDAATGPLAFGIWRKYVAFPRDFADRYDPVERNLALAHELGHHLRGDLIANWIALVVLALHWFNPVAWRAFRAFRADQELACDALVLSGRAPALRQAYGRAIVKSAHGGAVSAACHLHSVNELKGRLRMLSHHQPKSRGRILAGIASAAALTVTGLAVTASGAGAAMPSADAPVAPQAPAAPAGPSAPVAPPAPPAPAAPDAPKVKRVVVIERKDGTDTKTETRVIRLKSDGKEIAWSSSDTVRPGKCGGAKDDAVKVETVENGKRKLVICTDRIELRAAAAAEAAKGAEGIARRAEVMALASAELGKRNALLSLTMARRTIAAQTDLAPEQKAAALAGIDEAIRELEAAAKN